MAAHPSAPQVFFQFEAVSASNLPKMDLIGKIDAYVKFTNVAGQFVKTKVIDKNFNPVWKEKMTLLVHLNETVYIHVYDHDSVGDHDLAANATFVPQQLMQQGTMTIDLEAKKAKKGKATLTLTYYTVPLLKSFSTVAAELRQHNVPGHFVDENHHTVYVPIQGHPVYLSIEWEGKGKIDFKLHATSESVWLDWVHNSRPTIQVERKSGTSNVGGIQFVAEAKLDDITIKDSFPDICCVICPSTKTQDGTLGDIVRKAGWSGSMTYQMARQKLTGVDFDDKQEEIFFPLNEHKSAFFVCDFDKDGIDMKMVVTPAANDFAYDLFVLKGKKANKKSRVYTPPKVVCAGKYHAARINELDDLESGLAFSDFGWAEYSVGQATVLAIPQVVSLTL